MGLSRRRFFELVAGAVVPIISGTAWALDYPTRPVRIIVGNKEINAGLADPALNARLSEFGGTALKGGAR